MRTIALALAAAWAGWQLFSAPAAQPAKIAQSDFDAPRPIAAADTVFIEDMTWMEVRDAMRAGKKTVIVATGGVEENGPYLAAGKHNVILRATTDAIARRLGDALVAPIEPFVPEGDIDPPTGHMRYPCTVSVSEATFERLLEDICSCYRTHGFEHVVLLGDSGGNQQGMKAVAERLDARWKNGAKTGNPRSTRVHYIAEYYDYPAVDRWLAEQGIKQVPEGLHDDFAVTAQMMAVDPSSVRAKERIAAGKFHINGVALAPQSRSIEWGRRIVEFRAAATVRAIRAAIGGS